MDDRKLLEQAAKAADEGIVFYGECLRAQNGREWNPLVDDGDALRLAVACDIDINRVGDMARAVWIENQRLRQAEELHHDHNDAFAATRRAIVRAAAEIGAANA